MELGCSSMLPSILSSLNICSERWMQENWCIMSNRHSVLREKRSGPEDTGHSGYYWKHSSGCHSEARSSYILPNWNQTSVPPVWNLNRDNSIMCLSCRMRNKRKEKKNRHLHSVDMKVRFNVRASVRVEDNDTWTSSKLDQYWSCKLRLTTPLHYQQINSPQCMTHNKSWR